MEAASPLADPLLRDPLPTTWAERLKTAVRQTVSRFGLLRIALCAALGFALLLVLLAWLTLHAPPAEHGASAGSGCTTKEECLKIVDKFLLQQPRQTFMSSKAGLMQTFGPDSFGGGDCGDELCKLVEPCPNYQQTPHCRFDVYDNALAVIYLTRRGKLDQARHLLDGFAQLLYPPSSGRRLSDATQPLPGLAASKKPPDDNKKPPDNNKKPPDNSKKDADNSKKDADNSKKPPDSKKSPSGTGRNITLLAASYTDAPAKPGSYEGTGVADGAVDTGNNAWVGMAFAHFAAESGESCYAAIARDILLALREQTSCNDALGGFAARMAPYPHFYRSTEHNTDMFALATLLEDTAAAKQAASFVHGMYGQDKQAQATYATGTGDAQRCDASVPAAAVAVDTVFWNVLAGVDPIADRKQAAISFALQNSTADGKEDHSGLWAQDTDLIGGPGGAGVDTTLYGFRFSSWGHGIQWENTASAAMALLHYKKHFSSSASAIKGMASQAEKARRSLRQLLKSYGCVPASVLGGNIQAWIKNDHTSAYPGGSDTGIGWTYLRYPHVAATAWAGLLLLYQADSSSKVDERANPFSSSGKSVPKSSDDQSCLPTSAPSAPSSSDSGGDSKGGSSSGGTSSGSGGAACSAHPQCKDLQGNCCPTDAGDTLGCCS